MSYIDDYLLIGPNLTNINSLKRRLYKVYVIEDLGPVKIFLGVKIERDRAKRLL